MDNKNEQNPEFSALVEAINCNDVIRVNTILSKGFDVNQYGKNKTCTPLAFAVERENPQIVELLFNAGAEPARFLMLVLRYLAEKHNYKLTESFLAVTQLLIDANIELDFGLDTNRTLLMEAAGENSLDLVRLLVEGGADVNLVGRRGHYALMWAAHRGSQETYDYLAPLTSPELRSLIDEKEYAVALVYRQQQEDKLLKEFLTAVATGDVYTVLTSIEKGVNVNAFGADGSTALFIAANWGYVSIVRALLEAGANVNLGEKNNSRKTPLIRAAERTALKTTKIDGGELSQVEVIKLLIEAGANVNAKNVQGLTALMAAANAGSVEAVELLLKAGANVKHKTLRRETAMSMALEGGYQEIIQLLRAAGAK